MKKFLFIVMLFVAGAIQLRANDTIIDMAQIQDGDWVYCCSNKYERALIYPANGCTEFYWVLGNQQYWDNPLILDGNVTDLYICTYSGCGAYIHFYLVFLDPTVPTETTTTLWKRQGQPLQLQAVGADSLEMYDFHWNTGETTPIIEVVAPGIYTCGISDQCATAVRTFNTLDNVEVYRATVDLETKLNKVTWQVTPEQAEYISEVRVERDGMGLGSATYEQGYFMDYIGSENAARNYRLTGITIDGTECPITSYQKGTLHVDYSPNASNPNKLNMAWTPPFIEEGAPISVSYFQICKYDPNTGEVTVVDQIGANNTIGSYDVSLFDGGYAVVAAMFNEGKEYEELAFSNLTDFLLGIGENEGQQCRVYPNPANGRFTVEGTGTMRITNVLGQEIMTKEIDGQETVTLPKGMYFVQLNGVVQKIVVE